MIVVIVVSFICSRHVGNSENLGRRHNRKLLIIEKSASADSEYDRVVRRSMTYERPSMHEIWDVDEYKVMRRASRVLQYVVYQNSGSVRGTAVSRAIESTSYTDWPQIASQASTAAVHVVNIGSLSSL